MVQVKPREVLYAHLKADPCVTRLVDDRIYQRRVPSGVTKPLILIYPPVTDVPIRDLDGIAYRRAHIQVTAMAHVQRDAEAVARAVVYSVDGFMGLMAGTLRVIAVSVDSEDQHDQEGVDEIRHHIDVVMKYKG